MLDKKYWKGYPIPEKTIIEQTGYCVRQLWYLRKGRTIGNRVYSPVLIEGRHWMKLGGTVVYSLAGKKEIMKRRSQHQLKKTEKK